MFHRPTSTFLGNFLRDTLLVHSPVENSPADFPRVFALLEQRFGFRGVESEDFAVSADEQTAAAGVDSTR
jgi:hypothetical protein